jgi:uncharacterized damage-inducible protein DinB
MGMDHDKALRGHLRKLLEWEDAHVNFDAAVEGIAPALRGIAPKEFPYSAWQLIEHLRRTQLDILDFCRNPAYVEPPAKDYWPPLAVPPTKAAWQKSIASFRRDRDGLMELAEDTAIDLFARIPHGTGQTYLRELLLVADHNAYHVGQLITLRRCLGVWRSP